MLSAQRYQERRAGMTTVALKVLEVVPIGEAWPFRQLMGELRRRGIAIEAASVLGSLNRLIEAGLVREPTPKCFIAIPHKPEEAEPVPNLLPDQPKGPIAHLVSAPVRKEPEARPAPAVEPLQLLGQLAERARAMAVDMRALAADIDSAALQLDQAQERNTAAIKQLQAFKAMLQGIEG